MARSKRITFLAELTKGFDTVCDIGSDHGYVLVEAFKKGYINQGIASDLRDEPLAIAKKNLIGYQAKTIQSDGFLNIKDSFDCAIVAGMGAYLIADIMKFAPIGDVTYILQPNDKPEVLRSFLMEHKFNIEDEFIIRDRFFYIIMKVKRGNMTLTHEDIILGPKLRMKSEALNYYAYKVQNFKKLLLQVDEKRAQEIRDLIKIYELVLS
jgi:tRNA (adenine22-N1)-methyltransferase